MAKAIRTQNAQNQNAAKVPLQNLQGILNPGASASSGDQYSGLVGLLNNIVDKAQGGSSTRKPSITPEGSSGVAGSQGIDYESIIRNSPSIQGLTGQVNGLTTRITKVEEEVSMLSDSVREVAHGQNAGFARLEQLMLARNSRGSTPVNSPRLEGTTLGDCEPRGASHDHDPATLPVVEEVPAKDTGKTEAKELKITRQQHFNFLEAMEISKTPTCNKIFADPKLEVMPLGKWWDKVYCLKEGMPGWQRIATKIGIQECVIDEVDGREQVLEMLISFLDADLKIPSDI